MITCRVLPHSTGDGPTNMATDEALLEWVGSDPTHAILRAYTWSEPTLSLGYFQAVAQAETEQRWRGVPIVRRPTGGGALWHDRELTYAIALPAGHPLARKSVDLYAAVHGTIAALLADAGLAATIRGRTHATTEDQPKPFLCFADRDANDIVAKGVKIVGAAQRRRAGAVLQHGSLLLSGSPITPELPGVADLAALSTDPSAWSVRLLAAIPGGLDLDATQDDLAPEERRRVEVLTEGVYRRPEWTRRR